MRKRGRGGRKISDGHLTGFVVFGMPDPRTEVAARSPRSKKVGLVPVGPPEKSAIRRAMHPRGRQDTEEKLKLSHKVSSIGVGAACLIGLTLGTGTAKAEWKPTKSVEFIVPAGTGGGADQMARMIQGIIQKHNLMDQPLVVIN